MPADFIPAQQFVWPAPQQASPSRSKSRAKSRRGRKRPASSPREATLPHEIRSTLIDRLDDAMATGAIPDSTIYARILAGLFPEDHPPVGAKAPEPTITRPKTTARKRVYAERAARGESLHAAADRGSTTERLETFARLLVGHSGKLIVRDGSDADDDMEEEFAWMASAA